MSVVKTLLKVNVATALVLLIGIGNNVAIAGFFGLTRQVDAYYAANYATGVIHGDIR